jgi:predicted nucleic acid-binding protein
MYAGGVDHPKSAAAVAFLERVAAAEADGQRVYDLARQLFPEVLAITVKVMDEARRILGTDPTLTARDAVHAAVVTTHKLEGICSFDGELPRSA